MLERRAPQTGQAQTVYRICETCEWTLSSTSCALSLFCGIRGEETMQPPGWNASRHPNQRRLVGQSNRKDLSMRGRICPGQPENHHIPCGTVPHTRRPRPLQAPPTTQTTPAKRKGEDAPTFSRSPGLRPSRIASASSVRGLCRINDAATLALSPELRQHGLKGRRTSGGGRVGGALQIPVKPRIDATGRGF